MTPRQQAQYDKAERERKQVRDWLLELMAQSSIKPATKAELLAIARAKFGVSKNSFDNGWDWAIFDSGNEHWWNPSPRRSGTVRLSRH